MVQTENKGFYIKDDGTIVRNETTAKINQMKRKISSGGDGSNNSIVNNDGSGVNSNNDNLHNSSTSSKIELINGWITIICMIIGVIAGGCLGFSDSIVLGLVMSFVGFFGGIFIGGIIGGITEAIFK